MEGTLESCKNSCSTSSGHLLLPLCILLFFFYCFGCFGILQKPEAFKGDGARANWTRHSLTHLNYIALKTESCDFMVPDCHDSSQFSCLIGLTDFCDKPRRVAEYSWICNNILEFCAATGIPTLLVWNQGSIQPIIWIWMCSWRSHLSLHWKEDVSEVVFFVLGALTVVEIMEARMSKKSFTYEIAALYKSYVATLDHILLHV